MIICIFISYDEQNGLLSIKTSSPLKKGTSEFIVGLLNKATVNEPDR